MSGLDDGELSLWSGLEGGECVNPENSLQAHVVSCTVPHQSEVYAVIRDRGVLPEGYPGRLELREIANRLCEPRYVLYVGVQYEDTEFVSRPVVAPQPL